MVERTFDQEGLFLKGDLVRRMLPSGLVTAFLDLIAARVCPTGVVCLIGVDWRDGWFLTRLG